MPARQAVAITSVAESVPCLVGLIAYLVWGRGIDWALSLPLVTGALMG
ncbi:hypothetical protein [Caldichromatium japonicum]|nr:hypothetical protein [Caldichromatium japonicum]